MPHLFVAHALGPSFEEAQLNIHENEAQRSEGQEAVKNLVHEAEEERAAVLEFKIREGAQHFTRYVELAMLLLGCSAGAGVGQRTPATF